MRRRLPWAALAAATIALVAGFALAPTDVNSIYLPPIAIPFVAVGALLALRRPANPIGWLFLGFGTVAAIDYLAEQYSRVAVQPGSDLPGGDLASAIAAHFWHPFFSLFIFAFLLFPDGHLVSPRWRWFAYVVIADYGLLALSAPLDTDYIGPDYPGAQPLVSGAAVDVGTVMYGVCLSFNLLLLPIAGLSLVVRLRRSTGRRREQVRLFAYTVAAVMVAFPVILMTTGSAYGVLLFPLIPISAGVAILRHRLFDIDVVINRALVYGALTATLAGTYLGTVLLVGLAVGHSGFAVAVSTLAVAVLFRPLRARIQGTVDRRFYRRRYDAARTVEAFTARLRDEFELDAVGADLRAVVSDTVQPAHVSLWLRSRG